MKWADKRYVYYVPKYMYVTVLTLDLEQKYAKHTCIYISAFLEKNSNL